MLTFFKVLAQWTSPWVSSYSNSTLGSYLTRSFFIGTLSPDTGTTVPTVTDNLFSDGTISEHILSVSFEPITDSSATELNGELTWGVYIII